MASFHKHAELIFIAEYPQEHSGGSFRSQLEFMNLDGLGLVSAGVGLEYQNVTYSDALVSIKIADVFEQIGWGRFGVRVVCRATITSNKPVDDERPGQVVYKTVGSINSQLVGIQLVDYVDFINEKRSFSGRLAGLNLGMRSLSNKAGFWLLFSLAFGVLLISTVL